MSADTTFVIDQTTILSLLSTLAILGVAYVSSLQLLHFTTTAKRRVLFIWHAFDALVHFVLEGSFLFNCFFTYISVPTSDDYPHPASLGSPEVYFLGHRDRLYGNNYGSSFLTNLWQEYAKADKRWGGADLTVISVELLTVLGAAPLALYICELLRRRDAGGKLWFWTSILATAELYGGTSLDLNYFMFGCILRQVRGKLTSILYRLLDFRSRMVDWQPKS